jgi:uncharacterized protein YjgD (DUF1641 family)
MLTSDSPRADGIARSGDTADRILSRLDAIESRLARIEPLLDTLEQAPALAASAVDVVDEHAGRLRDRGVDPQARLERLLGLMEQLTDDRTMHALESALALAKDAPGLASMAVDIVDEQAGRLRDEGIDPGFAIANGARTALQFASLVGPREVHALKTVLASEALAPEAVAVVSAAAQALVECQGRERRRVGVFGLMAALRDPDVQRALDFSIGVARRFGAALEAGAPSAGVVQQQADAIGPRHR